MLFVIVVSFSLLVVYPFHYCYYNFFLLGIENLF